MKAVELTVPWDLNGNVETDVHNTLAENIVRKRNVSEDREQSVLALIWVFFFARHRAITGFGGVKC